MPRLAWRGLLVAAAAAFCAAAQPSWAQSADLVVNQSDSPDPGPAGGLFGYTLRIDNNGPDGAIGVTLTDTLPTGSTFVGVTATQGSCTPASGTVSCALGGLAFLANATVTIQVRLPTAGVYTNVATAASDVADPNPSNNVNVAQDTTAQIAADMTLIVTDAPDPVAAGQAYSYSLVGRNNGPNALGATDTVTTTFAVPAGACVTARPTGPGTCNPATGYPLCSGTITCTRTGALAAGASLGAVSVPSVGNVAGSIAAAFQIASSLPDGNTADNTITATTTVTGGSSNVSITKAAAPAAVAVGSNVTYTLTPRHNGGEPPGTLAPGVITVTDTLNANLAFVSASGSGWTCLYAAPTVTCTRPGPYAGGNYTNMPTIAIVATVNATGAIANSATIAIPEADPVPGNNTGSATVTGGSSTDLRMTKASSRNTVIPNQNFNYLLTVRNVGPVAVAASNTITVSDTLPAGVDMRGAVAGTGWTCSPSSGFPIAGPVAVTCTRPGPLAINTNAPGITIPVRASVAGAPLNTACVGLSGTGPIDGNAANDCSSVTVTASAATADLQLTSKTADPNPVFAGQDLTYVITVTNAGPDPSTNVTMTDTLGSLIGAGGFQSAVPSQGACAPSGVTSGPSVTLSCNLGTIAAGASATITVVVRPTIAATGSRINTATVTSPDVGDPNIDNGTRSVTSTVTAVADIAAAKSATPSPVRAGTPLTFVITASNAGPSTAQSVVATDTLPANAAFVQLSAVTGGGSCAVPSAGTIGGTVTCSWASIANAAQQTATLVVRPLSSAAGGTVDNSVSVTTATQEFNVANNQAATSTAVTPALVDVLVNKVDSVDPVALGQSTVYTVTVTNGGPSYAADVVLTDTFPSGSPSATFSYQGALTIAPIGIGACTEPPLDATSGTLGCTFPGIAGGQSAVVTYAMRAESIASGASGTTFNSASVAAAEPESQPANNATTHSTTSRRTADLSLVKSAPPSVVPGTTFSYDIVVTNNGPNASAGAIVTDVLPAGVVFQSASAGCAFAAGTVSCTLGTLASGASAPVSIVVRVTSPYTGATPLVNSASAASVDDVDPDPSNNASSASSDVGSPQTDLSLVKSAPPAVLAGAPVTWTLAIANAGPSAADGASFSDTLPAGVSGVGASCGSALNGAVCGLLNVAAGTVSGTFAAMPAGGSLVMTINATAPASGPLVNASAVSAAPGSVDPNGSNNLSQTSTAVLQPDVAIAKSHGGNFTQGQTGASYTLSVSNVGAAPTGGAVSVSDTLPAGLTATAIAGSGWTCTLSPLACSRSDALAVGASWPPITLTVDVAAIAPANLVNVASVSGGSDANLANNQASDPTTVTQLPDLAIVKTHSGNFAQGQIGALYTITASNVGPGPTSGAVTVADTLPAGLTATAIAGTGWTCTLSPLSCSRGDALAAGASWPPITLTVNVGANAGANLVNVASVSGGADPNVANNQASDLTTIGQLPDLAIAKTHSGNFTQGQTGATYAISVSNVGAGPTTAPVTVADTLPAGLTATAIAGSGWTCTLSPLGCSRTDVLAASASWPSITLTVDVAASALANLVNVATVGGGGDANPANNQASDPTAIGQLPDLAIAKTHGGIFTQGQIGATYTIAVSNVGPGPSSGAVTVADTLPGGLSATAIAGTGWTCTLSPLGCSRTDVLAAGASWPSITLTVDVGASAPANLVNVATVSGGGDTNPGNNQASDPTAIGQLPDLVLAKTHSGTFAQGQLGALYMLTVSNVGTGPTSAGVSVRDTLPPALTAMAIGGTGWTCTLAALECTRVDSLAAGSSWPPIALTVNVAPNAPATLVNVATIAGGGDANPSNNQASDAATIAAAVVTQPVPTLSPPAIMAVALVLGMLGLRMAQRRRRR